MALPVLKEAMHQVEISDQLFTEAARKAAAHGLSVERFVAEAVRLHLHDDLDEPQGVMLTPDQVEIVRQSEADIRAGKGLSMSQAEELLAARKSEWLKKS